MNKKNIGTGALLGVVLTSPLIAVMYLADQLADLPFVPFDLFEWMTILLPGPIITFGIDAMIDTMRFLGVNVADTAKIAEQVMAVLQFLVMGVVAGAVFYAVLKSQNIKPSFTAGLVLGALFGFPAIAISVGVRDASAGAVISTLWLLLLYLVWGVGLIRIYGRLERYDTAPAETEVEEQEEIGSVEKLDRRQFLLWLGGSAATITVVGAGLGTLLSGAERRRREAALEDTMAHNTEGPEGIPFPNANDPVSPVSGTRPEYTPIKDHYKVFIELEPTEIDGSTWVLPVTGMVDNPMMLTLDDIRDNYEPRNQYVTLSCISGRVGTTLISTTYWTGVSVQDILDEAGVQGGAQYLHITSGDGFYETVPLDLIYSDPRIMFCYAWDGNTLPMDHGYPLRIWLPDRFGMKQPKWITGVEVVEEYQEGYWVERGWDETAQVRTTSVIDTVAVDQIVEKDGRRHVPVGGIAFAGARGISKVEVRVDGGDWEEAQLRSPLSETTWVIWRYEWPFEEGQHTFEVRSYEGDGTLQVLEDSPARPDGATGIHSEEATIS